MPLPPLLRHIYSHGSDEVIRRGKAIHADGGVSLLDRDPAIGQVRFRVRNDQYHNYYTVTVAAFLGEARDITLRCQCPYNLGDICRHEVAVLFTLDNMVQGGFFKDADLTYDQRHTVLRLRPVSEGSLRIYATEDRMEKAAALAPSVVLSRSEGGRVDGTVMEDGQTFPVAVRLNDERYFDTSCSCDETATPLCVHKAALILHTLDTVGAAAFAPSRAPDELKSRLLAQYGYTLDDDLTGKFAFTTENGKIFLRVLDSSIKKVAAPSPPAGPAVAEVEPAEDTRAIGVVVEAGAQPFPDVWFTAIAGEADEERSRFTGPIARLQPADALPASATDEDRETLALLRKLTPEETFKYLRKALPFADFYDDYRSVLTDDAPPDVHEAMWEYLLPKYARLAALSASRSLTFIKPRGEILVSSSLHHIRFSEAPAEPRLRASRGTDGGYAVELRWILDGVPVGAADIQMLNAGLLCRGDAIYFVATAAQAALVADIGPDGKLAISEKDWPIFLREKLLPWRTATPIDFAEELVARTTVAPPRVRLHLREREAALLFEPQFFYDGILVRYGQAGEAMEADGPRIRIATRDEAAEESFIALLRSLHTDMKPATGGFTLPADAVLHGGWAFQFLDRMREAGVQVVGWEGLKTLRINPHRPETKVLLSSGTDWFDAHVEILFGEQRVTVADVKRALSAKQHYVALADGSLGMLPEEWLQKYALLLKVGESRGDKVRLKKFHFGVLDQLLAEVREDEVQQELAEKRERLAQVFDKDFSDAHPPEGLTASLRPYQLSGFQWLLFLKEAGWGGILADDMGLGKTVQALALFQHFKNEDADARFLVVCPTTLLYNWEAEVKKFTPGLKALIHHGPKRATGMRGMGDADVIISTYGTVRSDVKWLREFRWTVAVLDESQAIKNPQSQSAKAAQLLQADYRLALSGTPVQNNTFDLFSQMHYLNPGLLGSREKFASEFATPIDKFGEDDIKEQLRRLIHPFILRRTKEAVAQDLPAKTETTFWCEMGPEQRRIYDSYRIAYRDKLLGLIDEQGIERAQFHILQGLTKLRQICDSPTLIGETASSLGATLAANSDKPEGEALGPEPKNPARGHHAHSVKLEELVREIGENVGEHKALVFSQFLGMLALIRAQLEKDGIPYAYFDGSSTTTERVAAVNRFQEDPECRVFLISLKAGGVGLNLTAADYVYIVDPWWNPAVEQQAIDRTHRIGQTKAVFAYRMICRDSIEEKMLLLQERKRTLAADLVTADDGAFLKRLSREDVAFLLS